MITDVEEIKFINGITNNYRRSPLQLNMLHESDAEIVCPWNGSENLLALTTDGIVEEIATGLYDDPYLIGWMTVMVNLSDLAAVGATPIGLLISETIPTNYPENSLVLLQKGIKDACDACDVHVLGGDTNRSSELAMTGSAVGFLEKDRILTRKGCHYGDVLYSTSRLGIGNGYALQHFKASGKKIQFQPVARLKEGQSLRGVASACMDTSDGVLATLDQLMRINRCGFQLNNDWESALDEQSRYLTEEFGLPSWFLLAGEHGEFELLFTISPDREKQFLFDTAHKNYSPVKLGTVIPEMSIYLPIDGQNLSLDTAWIRNLGCEVNYSVKHYIENLFLYHDRLIKGVLNHVKP